jgi:hypothetical protein
MATDEGSEGGRTAGPDLQFDKVEHAAPAAPPACGRCQRVIDDEYFEVAGHLFCRPCAGLLDGGKGAGAFLRAAGLGAGAALIGTIIWFSIIKLFDTELGLLAIGVGLFVGFAVRKGARGLGGWKYQALAMSLTYMSITASYVPLLIKGAAEMAEKEDATKAAAAEASTKASADEAPAKAAADEAPAKAATPDAPVGPGAFVLACLVLFGIAFASPFWEAPATSWA